jgi:peptidoglycan/xylan/chitin deacetylase (PgdA/CDA1 family)
MQINQYTNLLNRDSLVIFLFHGVIKENKSTIRNYNRKHIFDFEFNNFLRQMKSLGTPISMDEVVDHIQTGKPFPPFAFSITFDDGFENNYSVAAPILLDLKIPAIFYVATEFIDKNTMSWVDQIDHCIEHTTVQSIRLSLFSQPISLKTLEEKVSFLIKIREKFKEEKDVFINRHEYISEIFYKCQVPFVQNLEGELDQKMSWRQLAELASNSYFSIGGHTHTHPILSFLSDTEVDFEIDIPLEKIAEYLKKPTRHFSYPEGLRHCYHDGVVDKLKKRGIVCAPTAIYGINEIHENLFNLKRVLVA